VERGLDVVRIALVGRYDVEKVLGRGGMAVVFLARSLASGQLVAVKVLRPEFACSLLGHRFHREIAILTDLHHPNILPLLESREARGLVYYVMPYAEGASLRQQLDHRRTLRIGEALEITRQVAAALDYAHGRNVVHRDIKPENIMFEGGVAKVCDFGVARAIIRAAGEALSSSGLVVGTPSYMSPEQATGESEVDGRSDIYSLACVLYEMLVGEPPFTGRSAQAIMAKQVKLPPPLLRVVRPEVPEHVERTVHRALAKAPAERPSSGGELINALAAIPPDSA
jgi:serine/threonine-protein kinase